VVLKPVSYVVTVLEAPYDSVRASQWKNEARGRYLDCPPGKMRLYEYRWALPIPRWFGRLLFAAFGETVSDE